MRYTRFIIAALALFATACTIDPIDYPAVDTPTNSGDVVTVIGRITRFDDKDVTTRGVKDEAEAKLTSMAMALFPVVKDDNGYLTTGPCDYYEYTANQAELLFTIDRTVEGFDKNEPYAMYVFCNMPGMADFTKGDSLAEMLDVAYSVNNINIPENGFPMIGSLGDRFSKNIDQDGQTFILAPTVDGNDNTDLIAPTVDDNTQTLLTVPMKALFAKVNFTIEVSPDQTIEGNYSPQFTLSGYTVNNVPSSVDFSSTSNSDTEVLGEGYTLNNADRTTAVGANKINFSFYLPERLLTPTTTWENYQYPFGKGDAIRDEDLVYRQRYKSKLLSDAQKATNIVISGRFRDHQNHYWDVDYTIYLGEDNFGDFNIKRNSEYNNYVTIRGIQTSNDMSDEEDAISIDHRVNVTRTQPGIITLRREVLLDSHFEVRPLRVRKSDIEDVPANITHVKVEVVDPTTTNWMRLERSFGDGTPEGSPETKVNGQTTSIYIDSDPNSPSYGKRKFFTYNLIDGVNANATDATLKNSTEAILPLTDTTECCWIYVDECTDKGDGIRAGQIKVSYGSLNGSTFTPANNALYPDVTYIINQRKLFNVTYDIREYCIEYEEEYLHNFDADDNYGDTEFQGMEWGLEGIQLSYDHEALFFSSKLGWDFISDLINNWKGDTPAYYDFYITSHDADYVDEKQAELHDRAGFDFCSEIIQTVNGGQKDADGNAYDSDPDNDINILQLDEQPKSAIEYCYNKNKRNNKGEVVWQNTDGTYDQTQLNWYLPAIDEIEEIVMSEYGSGQKTYARFLEFQDQDYWSCQPAYLKNYARYDQWYVFWTEQYYGDFFCDDIGDAKFDLDSNSDRANVGSARSTSVKYNGGYSSTPSGTNGYYYYYDSNDKKPYYTGSYNGKTMNTVSREEGNQPRTEKNRVRCVRKK